MTSRVAKRLARCPRGAGPGPFARRDGVLGKASLVTDVEKTAKALQAGRAASAERELRSRRAGSRNAMGPV